MSFAVSIIVPVYRAEAFVEAAVGSALTALDVAGLEGEVLLVEDGSPDGSLAVCQALAATHRRVRLYRHEGGGNHGAGASRNLGVAHARFPWLAFLDADDLFLPNRFLRTAALVTSEPDIDGVYEPTLAFRGGVPAAAGRPRGWWRDPGWKMPRRPIDPQRLFDRLVFVTAGTFNTPGVTLRGALVQRLEGFPASLRLSQDMALWVKAAARGRLVGGDRSRPAALVRRHTGNRSFRDRRETVAAGEARWRYLYRWFAVHGGTPRELALLRARLATSALERRAVERGGLLGGAVPKLERVLRYLPKGGYAKVGAGLRRRDAAGLGEGPLCPSD